MAKPGPISAKPLSVLLSDVFSDAYAKQGFAARELVTRWSEIAGPEVAAHSEPLKIQWPRPVEGQPQEPATLVLRVEGPTSSYSGSIASSAGARWDDWPCGRRRCRAGIALRPPAPRTRNQWRKSQKPCPRSRMRNCARRWRGSARRSSEIEAAASCNRGPPLPQFSFQASEHTSSLGSFGRERANPGVNR